MPMRFPKAPTPWVSSIFSPLAWAFGRPDLFDSYSVGIILLQLAGSAMLLAAAMLLVAASAAATAAAAAAAATACSPHACFGAEPCTLAASFVAAA